MFETNNILNNDRFFACQATQNQTTTQQDNTIQQQAVQVVQQQQLQTQQQAQQQAQNQQQQHMTREVIFNFNDRVLGSLTF